MTSADTDPGGDFRSLLSSPGGLAALLLGIVVTALMVWWPLDFGAFFPTVLYPGLILILAAVGVLIPTAPLPISRRGPHLLAIAAFAALALWTLLSAFWSPVPDAALEDAIRIACYTAIFFVGLWLALSLGRAAALSLAPFVIAGAIVTGCVLVQALLTDNAATLLSGDGTLDYPLGYRNANAAFFFVLFWIAVGAASRGGTKVAVRSLCAIAASGALSLAVMSQSRGSLLAAAVALIVYLVTAGDRRRALLGLAVAAIPVACAVPILIEPFDAVGSPAEALPGLHHAAFAAVAAGLVSGVLMVGAALVDGRWRPRPPARIRPRPVTAAIFAGIVVVAALAIAATTDPRGFIDDRLDEFEQNSLPDLAASESRFSVTASSTRSDYWRVALSGFTDDPLLGEGSGGFEVRYLQDRHTGDTPRDAHSAPLEVLGELGLPGLLLLLLGFGAAIVAAIRSRRFGSDATLLTSVALTIAAYWAVHASIDWFWSYPIPTGIIFALLGSAAAASSRARRDCSSQIARRSVLAGAILLSIAVIPLYLAERLTVLGVQSGVAGNTGTAYDQLDAAADLDPLADVPLLAAAEIARRERDDARGLADLERAQSRQPDNYLTYLIRARILAPSDPRAALEQLDQARQLNPRDEEVGQLSERLERSEHRSGR